MAEAFLLSIHYFNQGDWKYVWPYYLPSTSTCASSFLEPAVMSILDEVRESSVLESCAGTMAKPASLKYVPLDPFADGEGTPFTLDPQTAPRYLSLKYPFWALESTNAIGVSKLSSQEFLEDLSSAIVRDPTKFHNRSASWHSQLAETLVKLGTDKELLSVIQDICLIPLHDGTWTCARGHVIFFSKSETSLEIPSGIEIFVLDPRAESDHNRRTLFTFLGVKAWEAPEICRLILQVHASPTFKPESLRRDQLISHAEFLYKASWQPPKTADLWFATRQDERCLGRKLYVPGNIAADSPAARIFTQLQKKFAVIHNDYLEGSPSDADWPLWLVGNLGLSMVPRLITPEIYPKPRPPQTSEVGGSEIAGGDLVDDEFDSIFGQFDDSQNINGQDKQDAYDADFDFHQAQILPGVTSSSKNLPPIASEVGLFLKPEVMEVLHKQRIMRDILHHQQRQIIQQQKTAKQTLTPEQQQILQEHWMIHWQRQRRLQYQIDDKQRLTTQQEHMLQLQLMLYQQQMQQRIIEQQDIVKDMFALSEEFTFMFSECHTSDILQLLRINWHHYSQWIAGDHMEWQNADFLQASTQLKNALGACIVQSSKGPLPLQETVLPMIDAQLEEGCNIPAVDIKNPQHPGWMLLSYFGVILKRDIQYYLRCLLAISEEHCPDVDNVAYIYEEIQARYKENVTLIRYVFYSR